MAGRLRSTLPLFSRIVRSNSFSTIQRSTVHRSLLCPSFAHPQSYASSSPPKEQKVKVPLTMYGVSGNYATSLYIAAAKANALEKVESELLDVAEASKKSTTFSMFMKDLSVPADTRIKAITEICAEAKFSDLTRNFLEPGHQADLCCCQSLPFKILSFPLVDASEELFWLRWATKAPGKYCEEIYRVDHGAQGRNGSHCDNYYFYLVEAIGNSIVRLSQYLFVCQPLPAEEEKELKETLQDIIGQGKKVNLEQTIDPSILGGLVLEFGQNVFDISIKTRAKQMERFLRDPAILATSKLRCPLSSPSFFAVSACNSKNILCLDLGWTDLWDGVSFGHYGLWSQFSYIRREAEILLFGVVLVDGCHGESGLLHSRGFEGLRYGCSGCWAEGRSS
ncbi:hypothetical protein RHSIM_Rhsim01G0129500 [Rhododendron simsii]|uniref:Uncharacterized protein n=1 Tax=Rhododendron simsii TaxID=118357 RepID=A0A834HGU7_RHOSS|nr:hypothetical protein RHSIM_Rhsim01G0129500 [Rhododendron simsii]